MSTTAEYRGFARECMQWAAAEESEVMRRALLAMAQQWMEAALRVESEGPGVSAEVTSTPPAFISVAAAMSTTNRTGPGAAGG